MIMIHDYAIWAACKFGARDHSAVRVRVCVCVYLSVIALSLIHPAPS